jgi:hypothetical protein|nr:MAG TPA: tail tape measure [Caudoviricetes sp.]
MADLGNLQFSILYKDDPKQLEKIKERALKKLQDMNLVTKVSGSINKTDLVKSVREALGSEQFKIGVVVDKASTAKAVRDALEKAGLNTNYSASDLRAQRSLEIRQRMADKAIIDAERYKKAAADAKSALEKLSQVQQRNANAANNHARASFNLGNGMNANIRIAGELKNQMLGIYSIYTIERFISSLVRVRGEFDMQLISLKAILQSGEKATELFNQIKSLSVISPFQFKDLIGFAKQLSAYQIPNSELFNTTKRLADLSAGLGVDMNRIILAYGQVRSAAFLRGQELRQFTEAGIPMVGALADKFSKLENRVVSTGEVFDKISKRQVPFEMVKEVMEDLTDEGGRFYMMQEKQSESLQGKISNLRDAYDIMLNSIGEANDDILKGSVNALTSLMENSDKLISIIGSLVVTYGAYRAMVILNSIALGKETQSVISETLVNKAKRADMLTMASMYRTLTKEEQIAISTRKQMTTADWRAVASSGALSKEHALRLVRLGKLTELQAMELTSIYATTNAERALYQSQVKKALSMQTNIQLGKRMTQVFGAFGITSKGLTKTVNSLKLGLWGMANGIGNAFVSLVSPANIAMLAIGALIYTITNYQKEQQELSNRIKQAGDAIKDSYDELNKFLTDNPLSIAFNNGNEGIKAFIDKLKEQVKENSPIAIEIIAKAEGIEDNVERLDFLRKALEDTAQAYLVASDAKDIFENANVATDDWGIDDKLDENLNDYAEVLGNFNYMLNSIKRTDILSDLDKVFSVNDDWKNTIKEMVESGKSIEEIYNTWYETNGKFAKSDNFMRDSFGKVFNIRRELNRAKKEVEHDFDTFYDELEKQISNKSIDVNSILGKTFVERLKKEYFTQNNVQLLGQELFNFKLDSKLYSQSAAVLNEIVRLMRLKGKEAVREFSDSGVWGEGMDKALNSAIAEVKMKFPDFKDSINKTINNQEFKISIKTILQVPDETEIQKWAKSVYLSQRGLIEGISDQKLINDAIKSFNISGLKPGDDTKSVFDIIDNLKKEADDYNDKIDELTKVYDSKKSETVKTELDGYIKQRDAIINQLAGYGYDYVRKGKNEEKDPVLELLKERFKQVKDFMSMYEKLSDTYGKADALRMTKDSGLFASDLFKNSTTESITENVQKEIEKIIKRSSSKTKDRRSLTESALSYNIDLGVKVDKENLQKAVTEIEKYISDTTKKWDIYKNALNSTNNEKLAMQLAFGGNVSFGNVTDELQAKIQEMMQGDKRVNIDFATLVGMNIKDIEQSFGKPLVNLVKRWQEETGKLKEETVKNFIDILKRSADFGEQIAAIDAKLQKDIADLESNSQNLSNEDVERRRKFLTDEANKEKSSVRFEEFKQTSDWVKVFDDLDRVSTSTLNEMIEKISEFAQQAGLSEKVTKQLVEAMRKLREESIDRNPFQGLLNAINNHSKWNFAKDRLGNNDSFTFKRDEGGFKKGQTITKKDVDNGLAESNDDMEKSALDIANKFKAVADAADLLGGMFENLGVNMDGFLGGITDILGGAASGAQAGAGIASALGASGPWGAAAGAAVGMLSAVFAMHDKKQEKIINESKQRVKELENLYDLIDKKLEYSLGSGASIKLLDAENDKIQLDKVNARIDSIRRKDKISIFDIMALSKYSKESEKLQKRVKAYNEGGAYGYQRALMQEQMSELEKQRQAEIDKKKTDDGKVTDYENQIAELKQQIKDFAEEMADSLYGINLKDWASQLGDALYEAWQKGEDGAEAFKKKAAEIMGDVMNSVLKLAILEPAMKNLQTMLFGEDGQSGMFGKDFKLDNSELENIADYLMGVSSKTDDYYDALDKLNEYMEKKYGVSMKEEAESSGLSKGIEGVTEDTANLLASYLNSVRSDVAMKLQLVRQIVDEHFPRMNLLAEAQLTELKAISRNTSSNVVLVTEIRDMLSAARLDKNRGFYLK